MTNQNTRVTAELNNNCLVLWRSEQDGTVVAKYVRDFPPRRTYPIAVLALDGSITRLTTDDLPGPAELDDMLACLRASRTEVLKLTQLRERFVDPTGTTLVAIDASGSSEPGWVPACAKYFSAVPGCEVVLFTHTVEPYAPGAGDEVHGGGTSFAAVHAYAENLPTAPARVLVVTDGFAPHIRPARPQDWVWAITKGGDPWPQRQSPNPMTTVFVS